MSLNGSEATLNSRSVAGARLGEADRIERMRLLNGTDQNPSIGLNRWGVVECPAVHRPLDLPGQHRDPRGFVHDPAAR